MRDTALDVIRGICILSMTLAHLARGSFQDRILHLPPWADGASGFVLLSGLVLGIVQHRRVAKRGETWAVKKVARRAVTIYGAQVALVTLALAGGLSAVAASWLPRNDTHGDGMPILFKVLLLQVNPVWIDVLSLYVILLGMAAAATWALHKGNAWMLAAASLALYVLGSLFPSMTTLPEGAGGAASFNWGTWQAIFLSGLIIGWFWREKDLASALSSKRALLIAGGTWLATVAVGSIITRGDAPTAGDWFFDKGDAGPGRVLMAWLTFILMYWMLAALRPKLGEWTEPVQVLGRHSLDAFIVLSTVKIIVDSAGLQSLDGGLAGLAVATATIAAMWGWAVLKERKLALVVAGSR